MTDAAIDVPAVKSAQRTVRILEILSTATEPLGLSELHTLTGYPKSSLHALLRTLRDENWVQSDSTGFTFEIGPRALLVGTAYLDKDPALPFANRTLEAIREETGHTVHYARRDADSVIYLVSRESMISVRQVYHIGRRVPASLTGVGQALLAELTDEEVERMLPATLPALTDNSITELGALLEELHVVRERGWAMELDEGAVGIGCIAAVVPYRIPSTDAISCSLPSEELRDEARCAQVVEVVERHTADLAAKLRRAGIR